MNVHRVQYEYPEFIFNEFSLFGISCSTWGTIRLLSAKIKLNVSETKLQLNSLSSS